MNIKNLIHLLSEMMENDPEVVVSNDNGTSFTIEDVRYDDLVVYIDVIEKFKD